MMLDIDKTVDTFRRGALDIDCKRMTLTQRKKGGERFEGQGYIRQDSDGALTFKIYVEKKEAMPLGHLDAMFNSSAGKLHSDEMFYDLDATAHGGTHWTASRILPSPHWDMSDLTVFVCGAIQSMTANLDLPQKRHRLNLHFFEEYQVPLHQMSKSEERGNRYFTLDRAEFGALGAEFVVRVRDGSGDTVFEIASDTSFPISFDLRVQEALQFITARTAIWRARLQSSDKGMELELASPRHKSARTHFNPPIAQISADFRGQGWNLFEKYLAYVVEKTKGTHWNPVAYHLYNACEATSASVDAWAAGVSIAVEAVASLIQIESDSQNDALLACFQKRALRWLAGQSDFAGIADRVRGLIGAMTRRGPKDRLYMLAATGHVEKEYIKSWSDLRNRHVHPTLKDLQKPDVANYQNLLDRIHKTETLLRQLTFYLIGYQGPFTDYGVRGRQAFPSKQYPLSVEDAAKT